jgi:hypothetical protein
MSGEAYSALAIVCRLWRGLGSFPRRSMEARFPPKADKLSFDPKAAWLRIKRTKTALRDYVLQKIRN